MSAPVAERLVTVEEFLQMDFDEGVDVELIEGRVVCMPPPYTSHGDIAANIGDLLREFVRRHRLGRITGEGGYLLSRSPDTVRAPDTAFLSSSRIPAGGLPRDAYIEGTPNLAVEVVSPSDSDSELATKVRLWLDHGAERVWEVNPRLQTVSVHRSDAPIKVLRPGDTLTSEDASFAVPGFELPVSEVFA